MGIGADLGLQVGASYEGLRGQDWPKHAYVVFEPISSIYR